MTEVALLFEELVRVDLRGTVLPGAPLLMQLFPSAREIAKPASGTIPDFEVEGIEGGATRIWTRLPGSASELDSRSAELLEYEDWGDLISRLEVMISRRLLTRQSDRVHLHASAALTPAGTILALGPSGAGKSSLALAWSASGYPIYGDDVVKVASGGTLEAHRRLLKVEVARLAAHGIAPETTVAYAPESPEAWFDPITRGGWADTGEIPSMVARIAFDPDCRGVEVRSLTSSQVLQMLIASTFPTGVTDPSQLLDRLLPIAERSRGVSVTFGSAPLAAAEMVALIGKTE